MVPSLFISHGSPFLAVQNNEYSRFLNELGRKYSPKAVVIFSAHWESDILAMTYTDDVLEIVYDYHGFPEEMYQIKYPAKGSTSVASLLEERFRGQGIPTKREEKRGLDHGSWVALKHMYPNADIPVVQLSVNPFLSAKEQYEIGHAIQGLGVEDILVIGSGTTIHNFQWFNQAAKEPDPRAVSFDDWLIEKFQKKDLQSLFQYDKLAPFAILAVPRAEHFVPLLIAFGSGESDHAAKVIYRGYEFGTFSNLCLEF